MHKLALMALALVLALAGMGAAAAYFSDTETHAMEFNAGEIDLQLSHTGTGGWSVDDGGPALTWSIGQDWAPGDTAEKATFARNAGTTGGNIYGFHANSASGNRALLDNTYMTDWTFTWGGDKAETSIWGDWCLDVWDDDEDGNVSLGEFLDSPWGPCIYHWDDGFTGEDVVEPNRANVEETTIYFEFNEEAGNELQNKSATVDFTFSLHDDYTGVHHVGTASPESYGYTEMG